MRRQPEFQQRLQELGYEPIKDTSQQFAADMAADFRKYTAIVKVAGTKANR